MFQDRSANILLVEDNQGDIILVEEALDTAGIKCNLQVSTKGEDALDYLFNKTPYETAVRPDLILLDLNLPGKNGFDVLKELKEDDELKIIPVIVLTTSTADFDIKTCYRLHANCYISKPLDFNQFTEIVRIIEKFWFDVAMLPNK